MTFRTKELLFTLLAVLIVSCNNSSEYPGYSKAFPNVYFKLLKIGENDQKCAAGDYVTADITYKTLYDSVFFKGRRKFQISKPLYEGSIDDCMMMLREDEAASFIIPANEFFSKTLGTSMPSFLLPQGKMKFEAEVLDIQTPKEYQKEKEAFLSWIEDFGAYEKIILKQYLEDSKLRLKPTQSGLYSLILKAGNEKTVHVGDTITVHYEGRFLNGKFFDSTRKRNEAFQFVYGQQWQVIKGLEEAIGLMHEGERSLFIMPSDLAFGETGSSTGIIPPFTSLIFEVELLKIN